MKSPLAILLLAAGASKRMGRPKQLIELKPGLSLLNYIIGQLSGLPGEIVLVLGANSAEIATSVKGKPVTVVHNPNWEEGLGSSIAQGINAISKGPATRALIALGDQPLIGSEFYQELDRTSKAQPTRVVATRYQEGFAGVPAIFPKTTFTTLASLKGDKGARSIIRQFEPILLDAQERTLDLDTPEELEAFLRNFQP